MFLPGTLDILAQDVRVSLRRLRREPTFALAVALTLSLGIGASTAVFGLVSTTLLSRIPYDAPDRLVVGRTTRNHAGASSVSTPDYLDYRDSNHSFDSLAAFWARPRPATVTGGDEPWSAVTVRATWNLFRTLKVDPVVGRHFLPQEETDSGACPVIVSFQLWQSRFGGSVDILGRTVMLSGVPHTIVGVLPRSFRFSALDALLGTSQIPGKALPPMDVDVWRLMTRTGDDGARHLHNYYLLGRLKPGVTMARAQADVDAISTALEKEYPASNKGKGLRLVSLQEYMGGGVRGGLVLPAAATGCLLLIACANVAGLLLARGQRRMSDVAVRSALGASRPRLVRQLLTESVALTLPAGVVGIGVAYLLQRVLLQLVPAGRLGVSQPVVDGPVLLFALVTSVVTGVLVGVVPALRGAAASPSSHLGAGRQGCERGHGSRMWGGLVALQIAISIVLLVGPGLVVRSLFRLSAVDLGFASDRILTARIGITASAYPDRARRQAFFTSVVDRIRALPGVVAAGTTSNLPIQDSGNTWPVRSDDQQPSSTNPREGAESVKVRQVSPGYFATMNMPIVRGRGIQETDRDGAPAVAVVSESLARRLYADRDPVGRPAILVDFINGAEIRYEIVGVIRDAHLSSARVGGDQVLYVSMLQANSLTMRTAVRTSGDAPGLAAPIRRIVGQQDRNALVADIATMGAIVDDAFADFRLVAKYLALCAGAALLLAAVGLYGSLAYYVSQQGHEIGVRMAMGATRGGILALVLRRGAWLVAGGVVVGVAAAYPGTRLVRHLLFETVPLDPATYASAVLVLGVVAATACLVPALRATRVDPAVVLRGE